MARIRGFPRYLLASAVLPMIVTAACGASGPAVPESTTSEAVHVPGGPVQVTERIDATSKDGVLFDIRLALSVFDHKNAGGKRDDAEVISPGKTEYQGIFPDGSGTLFIASCFAGVCQTGSNMATFEVGCWVESAPDPLPAGVSLSGNPERFRPAPIVV